ncbi:hypothetical protein BASA81_003172 [Batrachochytrium salamandrivorans]|nr:hypothetical protein BASA81_003172 [Batrachochytrium salamandrivorans]
MNDVPLCCNQCWNKLDGKAFKTSCDHCFCEPCADATFSNRNRRCSCCNLEVTSVLEFQVVGTPILDDQLTDVRSTLQAIACANGACFLDNWVSSLHRFERNQLAAWGSRQGHLSQNSLAQAEQREKELGDRELQARQLLISLEHENDQLRKDKENFQRGVGDLQSALEERTRQAENWRAMYEALKSGGRVSIPPPSSSMSAAPSSSSLRKTLPRSDDPPPMSGSRGLFENYRYNQDAEDNGSSNKQHRPLRERSGEYDDDAIADRRGNSRFSFPPPARAETFSSSSSSSLRAPSMPPPLPQTPSSYPSRSNSLPPARPPTRDTLTSLLNRSVVPRTASSTSAFRPPSSQQDAPVRSSFFSSSSLRAMSPNVNSNLHHQRGRLSQGGMLH